VNKTQASVLALSWSLYTFSCAAKPTGYDSLANRESKALDEREVLIQSLYDSLPVERSDAARLNKVSALDETVGQFVNHK
jgi:hypothetical protein